MRARSIDGIQYLDGGYGDNMPTALAARMGAEELVCVDLEGVGITRPNRTGLPTILVRSHWDLGDILRFDPEVAQRNMALGYFDTLRAFGRIRAAPTPWTTRARALPMPAALPPGLPPSSGRCWRNIL